MACGQAAEQAQLGTPNTPGPSGSPTCPRNALIYALMSGKRRAAPSSGGGGAKRRKAGGREAATGGTEKGQCQQLNQDDSEVRTVVGSVALQIEGGCRTSSRHRPRSGSHPLTCPPTAATRRPVPVLPYTGAGGGAAGGGGTCHPAGAAAGRHLLTLGGPSPLLPQQLA